MIRNHKFRSNKVTTKRRVIVKNQSENKKYLNKEVGSKPCLAT